jgi:hypothetical protein
MIGHSLGRMGLAGGAHVGVAQAGARAGVGLAGNAQVGAAAKGQDKAVVMVQVVLVPLPGELELGARLRASQLRPGAIDADQERHSRGDVGVLPTRGPGLVLRMPRCPIVYNQTVVSENSTCVHYGHTLPAAHPSMRRRVRVGAAHRCASVWQPP